MRSKTHQPPRRAAAIAVLGTFGLLGALALAGCGGGGGGGGGAPLVAPTSVSYPIPDPWLLGVTITPITPTVLGGAASSFEVAPALPAGIVLDSATGTISGTPTALAAVTSYTIRAVNASGAAETILDLGVSPQPPCNVDYGSADLVLVEGQAFAPLTPSSGCGTVDTWSIAPSLPAGLLFDVDDGTIGGLPTAISVPTVYTITATNSVGAETASLMIEVTSAEPCSLSYPEPVAVYPPGAAIPPNTPWVGCGGADSFQIDPPLPNGLLFDTGSGTISGTPTDVTPNAVHTVTATNAFGSTTVSIEVRIDRVFIFSSLDQIVPYDPATGVATFSLSLYYEESPLNATFPSPTVGASIALAHDPSLLTALTVTQGADVTVLNAGAGPDYWYPFFNGEGITIGVLYSFMFVDDLTGEVPREIAVIEYETAPGAFVGDLDGATLVLPWANTLGYPPVDNLVVLDGTAGIIPVFVAPTIELVPIP